MAQEHERYAKRICTLMGERLEELRDSRGVSVNWLADFSGLDRGYVSRILRGHANPTIKRLALLANALDVPFSEIFDFKEPRRPGPRAVARRKKK